ncbi:hypothetical protein [Aquisphaera insulae]|uniref:hypothetical protein n=1 Tax=Aquisphaera insulae TaxID=2712864 RepID=UPI0013EB62B8|nr:hypothetical protein [Aquisphaera insulae]
MASPANTIVVAPERLNGPWLARVGNETVRIEHRADQPLAALSGLLTRMLAEGWAFDPTPWPVAEAAVEVKE